MRIGASNLDLAESEHGDFVDALVQSGAEILEVPFIPGAYDSVFMKDAAIILEKSRGHAALLAKPFSSERQIEPSIRAFYPRSFGIHVEDQSQEFLEGGDVVFNPSKAIAFMGYGYRTSIRAKTELERFLNIEVTPLHLVDPYFFHLDTAMNLICDEDQCTVFAYPTAFSETSWCRLCEHPLVNKVVAVSRHEAMKFALNWVEVGNTIILGHHVPETELALQALGKKVLVRSLSQFQLAGGSAACLVAAVHQFCSSAT